MKRHKATRKTRAESFTLPRVAGILGVGAITLSVFLFFPPGDKNSAPAQLGTPVAEPVQPASDVAADVPRWTPASVEPPFTGSRPIPLAIVVDDAGHNVADAEVYLRFPRKLTVAVLPQLAFSKEVAALTAQAGKEVILHQPMEPSGASDPGPGAIVISYDAPMVIGLLEQNFASVGTRGMNNHMGSLATADPHIMDTVMAYLKRTDRFFLDSRTTPNSVAAEAALRHGVPFLSRDVFLDVSADEATVEAALDRGLAIGRKQGRAILIGHVTNRVVISVLERRLSEIEQAGFELVLLSELLP